jgi:murein DD-endopeptidase MepM/ murein hydrolase activator NlpD
VVKGEIMCPTCNGVVDVRSKHVAVFGGTVRVYCSDECLSYREPLPAEATTQSIAEPPRRRRWGLVVVPLFAAAGAAAWLASTRAASEAVTPPAPAMSVVEAAVDPQPPDVGDPRRDFDDALTAELARDTWIHPLAGPTRRMPSLHTGAFGAERPGERPPECISGHCGVDLGHTWGERVYAVHEGVVDYVMRDPNDEKGGMFVRVAHRGGTLYSWYFHLAAIPRNIRPGEQVSVGTLVGLLGDTGVKQSGPHLHFALSVRTSKTTSRYLDPEPLIALWPLWLPNEDGRGGHLSTVEAPGVPVRSNGKRRKRGKSAPASDAPSTPAPAAPAVSADPAASVEAS